MADGHCSVFLYKHHCGRFSYYKASSDNNCLLAGAVDSVMIQNFHTCLRRAGREADLLACENAGHGKICHAVNVFFCSKSVLDHCLIQMLRKRTE